MAKQFERSYKLVIITRADLQLPKGKLAVQCAHAAVDAALHADKDILAQWHRDGAKKVALKVKDEKGLLAYFKKAKAEKLPVTLVADAGLTVVPPGTKTCIAIGPDEEKKIDKVTGELPLL